MRELYGGLDRVPDDYLLWFHHVPWDHRMASGRTLWDELTARYCRGVEAVRGMQATWQRLAGRIDRERFDETRAFLAIQEKEARWWRDASVLYFQTFSNSAHPDRCGAPAEHARAAHGDQLEERAGKLTMIGGFATRNPPYETIAGPLRGTRPHDRRVRCAASALQDDRRVRCAAPALQDDRRARCVGPALQD